MRNILHSFMQFSLSCNVYLTSVSVCIHYHVLKHSRCKHDADCVAVCDATMGILSLLERLATEVQMY